MLCWDACPPENKDVGYFIEMWRINVWALFKKIYSHVAFKLKLKQIIGDFGSTLTGEHKHLIPTYSDREVTARRRNLPTLVNLVDTKSKESRWREILFLYVLFVIIYFKIRIEQTSSQHACSRSCRLIVHMSFSLDTKSKHHWIIIQHIRVRVRSE